MSQDFHVILVRYLPEIEQNQEMPCLKLCEERGLDVKEFVYNREQPSGIGPLLAKYVSGFDRVFVDISCTRKRQAIFRLKICTKKRTQALAQVRHLFPVGFLRSSLAQS